MYNRYVFCPDGSCRKDRVPEEHTASDPQSSPQSSPQSEWQAPSGCSCRVPEQRPGDFLKNLLPQHFDTGDLFVILLLLLMAGDSPKDRNNALLTIALYFIL